MELLTFFLVSVAVYAGLLFGALLSYGVKEELRPGEQYFKLAKRFIYMVLLVTTVLIAGFDKWAITLAIFALLAIAYIKFIDSRYLQLFLGVILYYFADHTMFGLIAALIFLFNFPTATLMVYKAMKKKLTNKRKVISSILITHAWFFAGVVFFLLNIK